MSMCSRAYPFSAWVLKPSGKPAQVEVTGDGGFDWVQTSSAKCYARGYLHATEAEAVAEARRIMVERRAKLDRMLAKLAKFEKVVAQAEKRLAKGAA